MRATRPHYNFGLPLPRFVASNALPLGLLQMELILRCYLCQSPAHHPIALDESPQTGNMYASERVDPSHGCMDFPKTSALGRNVVFQATKRH